MGAGANLGGYESGYVELSLKNALDAGDEAAIEIWSKTGMKGRLFEI